ncbi:Major facilitator superfamily transporter [Hanseniaspora valbyensis]
MDQYTNPNHPLYVPGTFNIYAQQHDLEQVYGGAADGSQLKRDSKSGTVLMPQPSDSPNDPLNWSQLRKFSHFALMTFITAFTAATSNDAGAAQDSLNEIYGISYDAMNTGAGVLFLAIGWGTLFLSPFPNLYGRKITYLVCLLLGLLGSVWFGSAKKTSDTIWSQLFVGASESCAEAHVQLSLTDIFFQHQLGAVLTGYIMATSIGTFLGPLIAGYISSGESFRWVGWWAVIIYGASIALFILTCEETYFDRSLYITPTNKTVTLDASKSSSSVPKDQSAIKETAYEQKMSEDGKDLKKIHKRTSDEDILVDYQQDSSYPELIDGSKETVNSYWKRMAIITPATNLKGYGIKQYINYLKFSLKMFAFPAVWISGLFWGWQDVLLSFYLTIEEDNYYEEPWFYSDAAVAIMNVPTLIGAVIGCMYAGIISDHFVMWLSKRRGGIYEAEYRLWFSFAVAIISPAGLLMFGIASGRGFTDWRCAYVGLGFIGFGWGCAGDIAMAYLMDCYPEMVLEGMVCTALINNNLACIFTFTCSLWIDASGVENTFIALAVLTFFFSCTACPMYIYGKKARVWSKNLYLRCISERDT